MFFSAALRRPGLCCHSWHWFLRWSQPKCFIIRILWFFPSPHPVLLNCCVVFIIIVPVCGPICRRSDAGTFRMTIWMSALPPWTPSETSWSWGQVEIFCYHPDWLWVAVFCLSQTVFPGRDNVRIPLIGHFAWGMWGWLGRISHCPSKAARSRGESGNVDLFKQWLTLSHVDQFRQKFQKILNWQLPWPTGPTAMDPY